MTKKFGELDKVEKKELLNAWVEGKQIECYRASDGRWIQVEPSWQSESMYRIAGKGDMNIPWNIIRPELKYAAKDQKGFVFLYECEPFLDVYEDDNGEILEGYDNWQYGGLGAVEPIGLEMSKTVGGDCDWKDSLTKRS